MVCSTEHMPGVSRMRFSTERGTVVVMIHHEGDEASIDVFEESAALSAVGVSDEDFAVSPAALKARNRFGTGLMREVFRHVREANPEVRRWTYDRRIRDVRAGRL